MLTLTPSGWRPGSIALHVILLTTDQGSLYCLIHTTH
jgi:hypothetical protein